MGCLIVVTMDGKKEGCARIGVAGARAGGPNGGQARVRSADPEKSKGAVHRGP